MLTCQKVNLTKCQLDHLSISQKVHFTKGQLDKKYYVVFVLLRLLDKPSRLLTQGGSGFTQKHYTGPKSLPGKKAPAYFINNM
jgi:hypothetical protein